MRGREGESRGWVERGETRKGRGEKKDQSSVGSREHLLLSHRQPFPAHIDAARLPPPSLARPSSFTFRAPDLVPLPAAETQSKEKERTVNSFPFTSNSCLSSSPSPHCNNNLTLLSPPSPATRYGELAASRKRAAVRPSSCAAVEGRKEEGQEGRVVSRKLRRRRRGGKETDGVGLVGASSGS